MERKLPKPGFWVSVLLVGLVLFIQVVLAVPLGILDVLAERFLHHPGTHLERQPLLVGCINLVSFGAAIALGLWLNRMRFGRAFPMRRISVLQLTGVAITVLGTDILLSELDNMFRVYAPLPQWLVNFVKEVLFSNGKLPAQIFLLVIVAPLTEELLFRGIILRGLLSRHRPAAAILLAALLFAAVHLNPWQFFSPLFLGLLFGWFYWRTGSVWLNVLAHAYTNGLTIIFQVLPVRIPGMVGMPDSATLEFQPWWLDICGLVLLPIGLWLFRKATPPLPEPALEIPPIINVQQ